MIASQAVLIAIAVDGDGRRQVLAVELANRESRSSWRDFLSDLKQRGLRGVEFVVSDDHPGLKAAIREVLTEAVWQRCYVHFLRNALDYVPRKVDDDCLMELRWFYDRRDLAVRRDVATWLGKWQGTANIDVAVIRVPAEAVTTSGAKLCAWVEDNIEETLTFYRLPLEHACGADLPQCCELFASGARACGGVPAPGREHHERYRPQIHIRAGPDDSCLRGIDGCRPNIGGTRNCPWGPSSRSRRPRVYSPGLQKT